jgi:hypothetical protein
MHAGRKRSHSRRGTDRPASATLVVLTACLAIVLLYSVSRAQEKRHDPWAGSKIPLPNRSIVLDGSCVHNIGELQMNVTNWGFFGSLPGSRYPMAESPSAQWPAGSGTEYLYAAGLWVGALKDGQPVVSTGYPETEFYPTNDPRDVIYRATQGDPHGTTWPSYPDDDGDGLFDEDWLNGMDDDLDGLVDEDFAAKGNQMFTCWYTDDQDVARTVFPEHEPIGLHVRQETYQWGGDYHGSYICVSYKITNIGESILQDVYVGLYADLDAGPRRNGSYYLDDMIGRWQGVACARKGGYEIPVNVNLIYVRDDDGDSEQTLGCFGIVLLENPIVALMDARPGWLAEVGLRRSRYFKGLLPFENGGEPTNDYQRYESMADWNRPDDTLSPGDYRVLFSYPVAAELEPGDEFYFNFAFVAGKGLPGIKKSAAAAVAAYRGLYADLDQDPDTGIDGRETAYWGPADDMPVDPCNQPDWLVDIPAKDSFFVNLDCQYELWMLEYQGCYKKWDADITYYMTGVDGKEKHIKWVVSSAPVPPHMRLVPGDGVVSVLWDNYSEIVPDLFTMEQDFEGYMVYRADDWHRPYGTNEASGPAKELWTLLDCRDLVNAVPPNEQFKMPLEEGGWEYEPLMHLRDRQSFLDAFTNIVMYAPLDTVPCPPGLTMEECDTLEAIARYRLGFEGGRCFYRYDDRNAKNGLPYFYSVVAFDHRELMEGVMEPGLRDSPMSNFQYIEARSDAQEAGAFKDREIYVVPNPVTSESMAPWSLEPNNADPTGLKCEFRNLPECTSTVRIFTVAGDLVQVLYHDGSGGNGTLSWDLLSRNSQDVTSGVYIYAVEPDDSRFARTIGKFVVIR